MYPPCKNAACPSFGTSHPSCRCYAAGMAEGGSVQRFCDSDTPHGKDCQYYAEGGNVDFIPDHQFTPDQPGDVIAHGIIKVAKHLLDSGPMPTMEMDRPIQPESSPIDMLAGGLGAKLGKSLFSKAVSEIAPVAEEGVLQFGKGPNAVRASSKAADLIGKGLEYKLDKKGNVIAKLHDGKMMEAVPEGNTEITKVSGFADGGPVPPNFIPDAQFKPDGSPAPMSVVAASTSLTPATTSHPDFIPDDKFQSDEEKYSTLPQMAITALEGAAQGASLGISSGLERAIGVDKNDILMRHNVNPGVHALGETTGLVASSLLPGYGEANILSKAGAGAAKLAGLATAKTTAEKLAAGAVSAATENAIYSATTGEVGKLLSGDPTQSVGTAMANIGLSALLGAGVGTAAHSINPLWRAASETKLGQETANLVGRLKQHITGADPVTSVNRELGEYYANTIGMTRKAFDLVDKQEEVTTAYDKFKPALDKFERKFTTEVPSEAAEKYIPGLSGARASAIVTEEELRGMTPSTGVGARIIDPEKVAAFVKKPSPEVVEFLDASKAYKKAIHDIHVEAGVESPIQDSSLSATKSALGKDTAGAKLADALVKKGLNEAAGKGAGAAIGGALGHMIGAGGFGALIGAHTLGPFLSDTLPSIVKQVLSKPVNALGMKAAAEQGLAVANGERVLSKGIRSIFTSGREAVGNMPSEKDRERLDKALARLKLDPSPLQHVGGHVDHYLEGHGAAIGQTAANAVNYLNSLKPNTSPQAPLDPKMPASSVQKAEYDRALNIAERPLSVIDLIRQGTITPGDLQHLKTLYPGLYDRMSQKLLDGVISAKSKGEMIPYPVKMSLSMFLAQPLDSTMTPSAILAAQQHAQSMKPQADSASQQMPKRSTSSLSKLPGTYQTLGQSSEMRRMNSKH